MRKTEISNRSLTVVFWLLVFGLVSATCMGPRISPALAQEATLGLTDIVAADIVRASQACVHETTWAGRESGTVDCGGIVQVIQNSRRPGESFTRALARRMPRFFHGTTDRSWVLGLRPGPVRANPIGWPYAVSMRAFDSEWNSVYARTRGFMLGTEALPCTLEPVRWFGRTTDSAHLAAALESGNWVEAQCGESRNAFLAPAPVLVGG